MNENKWIPIVTRPMTPDEIESLSKMFDLPVDLFKHEMIISAMPEHGQRVLVSKSWGVDIDTADNDVDAEGFVYYGLEDNGDWDGITAWMPLPEPYTKGGETNAVD